MATATNKLSLRAAILININIMLGSGIFTNTVLLAQLPGALGFLVYLLVGLMLFPLIFCLARLIQKYPDGGFYTYAAQELHPWVGFFSTWAYFTGKLASAALSIHVFCSLMQHLFPQLNAIPIFMLDGLILSLFTLLNLYNMRTGTIIQGIFLVLKSIPIIFAIIVGFYLFKGEHLTSVHWIFKGIPLGIPFVVFAFGGFETSCSISRSIENPEKNGPRALILSFLMVIGIVCLFQFALYASLGDLLEQSANFKETFPALFKLWLSQDHRLYPFLVALIHIAMGISALGASYGILFGNSWNLYTLAQHNHVFASPEIRRFNKQLIPYWCVLIEALFCVGYLLLTGGEQKTLQQLSALGSIIAYSLSVVSLLYASYKGTIQVSVILPLLGLASCIPLFIACIRNFFIFGIIPLIIFGTILIAGMLMYLTVKNTGK